MQDREIFGFGAHLLPGFEHSIRDQVFVALILDQFRWTSLVERNDRRNETGACQGIIDSQSWMLSSNRRKQTSTYHREVGGQTEMSRSPPCQPGKPRRRSSLQLILFVSCMRRMRESNAPLVSRRSVMSTLIGLSGAFAGGPGSIVSCFTDSDALKPQNPSQPRMTLALRDMDWALESATCRRFVSTCI